MPPLSRYAWAYLVAVVAAGPIALGATMAVWRAPYGGSWPMAGIFVLLGVLAVHFPLQISEKFKVTVATAVYFAALLLFGPPIAVVTTGAAELLGGLTLAHRTNPRTGRTMRGTVDTLFNTGQMMCSVGIAGILCTAVVPQQAPIPLTTTGLCALAAAAAAMYLVNNGAVAVIVGLQLQKPAIPIWLDALREDAVPFAGLYLVGTLGAVTATEHPWAIALLSVPTALLYVVLNRQVQMRVQTLAAVEALADVVDVRDRYTAEHSSRVAQNAELMARALGLPPDDVVAIRRAARVHDLGKVATPDAVLHKPGKLTLEEWAVMKQHPEIGYQILRSFSEYKVGLDLVRLHHERVDGGGYPLGIGGERLPIGAQVIALCDTLDAMTSDRLYRRGLSFDVARAEIRRGRGTQFHPSVVDAFDRLVTERAPDHVAFAQAAA